MTVTVIWRSGNVGVQLGDLEIWDLEVWAIADGWFPENGGLTVELKSKIMWWVPVHRRPSFAVRRKHRNHQENMLDDSYSSFFLSTPKTERIDLENHFLAGMEIGHAAIQGLRAHFEDKHIITTMKGLADHAFVAVLDGHAGTLTAEHAAEHLASILQETKQWKKYVALSESARATSQDLVSQALVQAFLDMDDSLRKILVTDSNVVHNESGSAVICALISPSHIYCANLGDCRCVLASKGDVVAMSADHKPSLYEEEKRIQQAGGFVQFDRVNGMLAMSRALGDFTYKMNDKLSASKQLVIAYPDISVRSRSPDSDMVLILACDGVWDVVSNYEAANFVTYPLEKQNTVESSTGIELVSDKLSAQDLAESLVDWALKRESTDNISAVVVKFPAVLSQSDSDGPATKRQKRSQ